ncbi:hypothetical protein Btru_055961 [Bulinus truncatus]|nr:hypothetical protein Btru_055961 [Bulinus truncatus]
MHRVSNDRNNANNDSHQHSTHGGKDLHSLYGALEDEVRRKEKEMLKPNNNTEKEIIYENISTDRSYDMYPHVQQTNLLLLGKTGNGKSSLGNSILGRDAFESKPSMESVTKNVMFDFTETLGERFKVVDTPGVGDTRAGDSVEDTRLILTAMSKAISLSPQGYHAFLLVVKFGGRFTEEDRQTDRLFNNITKDKAKKKNQLNVLLKVIRDLKQQNCCYSDEHFNAALTTRNILLVESKKELIEEEIMVEARLIIQRLQVILETVEVQHGAPFLNDILLRANALYEKLNEKDQGTGVMYDLTLHIWSLISSIRDELKLSECMKEKMDGFEKKKKKDAKELRYQREMFEKYCHEGREREEKKVEMLQKQIDIMNEKEEQWRKEKEEIESNLKAFMGGQKEKVRITREKVKKLKDQQAQYSEKKISKGVFTKLARVLRLKKEEDENDEIDC